MLSARRYNSGWADYNDAQRLDDFLIKYMGQKVQHGPTHYQDFNLESGPEGTNLTLFKT